MTSTRTPEPVPRPRSPWSGSRYETWHRWQLDRATSLAEVSQVLGTLAEELTAAHHAGWSLVEPMRSGRLTATRPSRRQRTGAPPWAASSAPPPAPPAPPWRLRVVDEPPEPGCAVFDPVAAPRTPVLSWDGHSLDRAGGPDLPARVRAEVVARLRSSGLRPGEWGVAHARVGPNLDLVAVGGALRVHAVRDGALVRTCEALLLSHAADRAGHLLQAAAAYRALARTADAMAAAGGRLSEADDGFVQVRYGSTAR